MRSNEVNCKEMDGLKGEGGKGLNGEKKLGREIRPNCAVIKKVQTIIFLNNESGQHNTAIRIL